MDDGQIVDLYLNRDESAVRQTAEKYGARLRHLALGITGDEMTAEECENDTYLDAWNRIPPADPRTYLYAFLARIARHIAIDRIRERSALKRDGCIAELSDELAEVLASADNVEREYDEKLLGEAISRYLGTLPKEKRMMFVGRYFYLDTVAAVASKLGVSESKVKITLFRVRCGLREYLIGEGFDL